MTTKLTLAERLILTGLFTIWFGCAGIILWILVMFAMFLTKMVFQ